MNLPGNNVYVNNAKQLWPPSSGTVNLNDRISVESWQLTEVAKENGMTLECDLASPVVDYAKAISAGSNPSNEPAKFNVSGSVMVDEGIKAEDLSLFIFQEVDHQDKIYAVVCYKNPEPSSTNKVSVPFTFSVGLSIAADLKEVVTYLFKEDPKTSRGTVTTVQHSSPGMINQTK
jgi:hypothetical protein